jgi:hypothetical protein
MAMNKMLGRSAAVAVASRIRVRKNGFRNMMGIFGALVVSVR